MSSDTVKLLPAGTEGVVEKIVQLGPTKFMEISHHVLERIPDNVDITDILEEEERERLLGDFHTDPASELNVCVSSNFSDLKIFQINIYEKNSIVHFL